MAVDMMQPAEDVPSPVSGQSGASKTRGLLQFRPAAERIDVTHVWVIDDATGHALV